MAKAKFYTYIHRRADTGEVFYVGKGSGKRFAATQGRSTYWKRIVAKHGISIEIVAYFFEEISAFDHEQLLIAEYRAIGIKLANMSDGGEGASGAIRSDETKARISAAKIGVKIGPFSDSTKAKMSAAHAGKKQSAEAIEKTAAAHRGMKRGPETLARMSKALKGKGVGREISAETRAKISALKKGKPLSEKAKENISAGHAGRTKYCVMSDDHKQKILAGQAAYWARRRAEKIAQETSA